MATKVLDPVEALIEQDTITSLKEEVMAFRLDPLVEAQLEEILSRQHVEETKPVVKKGPIYVCLGLSLGKYTCGQVFREGVPEVCPHCGTQYKEREHG